jgi:hypothetical protein
VRDDAVTEQPGIPSGAIRIPIGEEYVALVDEADAELVAGHRWRPFTSESGKVYAYTVIARKTVMMHRHILGTAAGFDTDHRDGNSLDNRRSNLRPATRAQNVANAPKPKRKDGRPPSSQFKGVCRDREKNKWRAMIRIDGRLKQLGRFDDEAEAARAYDRAALAEHPDFARPNFPIEASS